MRSWIAVVLLAALCGPAFADDRAAAKIHFQAAEAAEMRADWATAIEEYERAYELAPHPSVLFNMGNAHEKLGHFHAAAELFRRYLEASPNAESRAAVLERIERLRDRPSHVTVSFPPGATLVVDGQARGTIPIELDLPAGKHRFRVERDADSSPERELVVEYGDPLSPSFELLRAPPVTPAGRPPPTLTLGFGVGVRGGIGSAWDSSPAVSYSARLGASFPLSRKLRIFIDLDGSIGPSVEDDRIGGSLGPKESYFLFAPRAGLSAEVWRKTAFHLDAFAAGGLVLGFHSLSFGMEVVSRQAVSGAGAGGGIAFYGGSERSRRHQYFLSAAYFVMPAAVGDDTGFRSQGTVDVGGLELAVGYAIFLGPLATKPPGGSR
ncbi:MAG TPA: tetratricopeptide repeat protein [Kofleriaceae bacterium]|nr:tetratricopeptide repeat protein [Kofleriaceae bacterium]